MTDKVDRPAAGGRRPLPAARPDPGADRRARHRLVLEAERLNATRHARTKSHERTDKPLDVFWFIPVSGDGSYLGSDKGDRPADFSYLKQIAQAADRLGFGGVLIPVGSHCEDPWIVAAALAPHTERLRFLAALRPGLATPTHFARQAAALDRISNGRFLVNVVAGGDPKELAGDGIFLSHDERYAHAAEFLTVFRRLLAGETVDYSRPLSSGEGRAAVVPARADASCRSGSAARPSRRSISPPIRSTSTSPGASRWRRSARRSTTCARARRRGAARSSSACASISSCARPRPRPGRSPTS